MEQSTDARPNSDRPFFVFNGILSATAIAFLAWLLLINQGSAGDESSSAAYLPWVNAALNSIAAILILSGYVAIKRGKRKLHQYLMVGAFAASAVFLVSYIIHHYLHGDTPYPPEAAYRGVYLLVLASHVLLSLPIVPMALSAFYFAYQQRFSAHKRVTKILTPIWLYVSVTGVVIAVMLQSALAS